MNTPATTPTTMATAVRKSLKEIIAEKKAAEGGLHVLQTNAPTETVLATPVCRTDAPTLPTSMSLKEIIAAKQEKERSEQKGESVVSQTVSSISSNYISDRLSHLLYCLNEQDSKARPAELELLTTEERAIYFKQEQLLDRERAANNATNAIQAAAQLTALVEEHKEALSETFSLSITLNAQQQVAKELAFTGKSFVLTGAAGTGKTTAQREIASELLRQNQLGTHSFRIQGGGGYVSAPSIAFCAYTRIASGNLRRAIHKDPALEAVLTHNITTIHNLLEYTPETFWDYELNKESFRFIPKRTASNPLDITHLVIEEATMLGAADLWPQLYAALRPNTQIIFIGDINQLQPVFGASVFNYALTQLPVVELTQVYRQKEGSSILDNAHRILKGNPKLIEDDNFKIIRGGTVQHGQAKLAQSLGVTIPKWHDAGEYDPEQDIFLSPWNKHDLGTDNINKVIAQFLGDMRQAVVWEIIAGIAKVYLAVGDKVLFNKQVGYITSIKRNAQYYGKGTKPESKDLLRFGAYRSSNISEDEEFELTGYEDMDLDKMIEEEDGERKRQASHIVTILMETDEEISLSAVGDFSSQVFSLGYALTVHKAQGCEWRKVFFVLHKDHAISANRELLYTAVTRSREQCVIIAKDFMIEKAIKTQRVKGNTVAEKIAYFNSGIALDPNVRVTK